MLNNTLTKENSSWASDLVCLSIFFALLFFVFLGDRPLFTPDEGRYAEIAREMVVNHDYITPYLNGIKYFEKPVLFYWLSAAAFKIAGTSVFSIRSVNALLGVLGCLLTYVTARKLFDRRTGLLSALILGTSPLYFVMSHMVSLDLTVTFFITTSLYACLLALQQPMGLTRRCLFYTAALLAALAVLTKGLIGIVFPVVIVGSSLIIMREWWQLKKCYLLGCFFIFLLVAAPWHILLTIHHPEFFHFYFIEQQFLRYTDPSIGHYQPNWFFIPCLILGFFPWSFFTPFIFKNILKNRQQIFLILWTVFIFLFFSFSKSKLIPYILPIFPPLSILTARALVQLSPLISRIIAVLLTLSAACMTYFILRYLHHAALPNPILAIRIISIACFFLVLGSLVFFTLLKRKPFLSYFLLSLGTGLFLLFAMRAVVFIDNRSILPLTLAITPHLKQSDDVITYNQYYQDLPFYLKRPVSILNWQNELQFGMGYQDTSKILINDATFWQRFHGSQRVFIFMDIHEYDKLVKKNPEIRFYLIGKTVNNALISNQPLTP